MDKEKEYQVIEYKPKSKTKYVIGAFLATALVISSLSSDSDKNNNANQTSTTESTTNESSTNAGGQRLTDDNGNEYTLVDNGDGTETAAYDDGKSVTFQRQEDGSLDYLAGTAGLIAGLAAGYYMFHGFSNTNANKGTWDAYRNRYTVSEPLKRNDTASGGGGGSTSATKSNSSTTATSSTANTSTAKDTAASTNNNSKVNLSKDSSSSKSSSSASTSSSSSAKSGFGSAGARSSSS